MDDLARKVQAASRHVEPSFSGERAARVERALGARRGWRRIGAAALLPAAAAIAIAIGWSRWGAPRAADTALRGVAAVSASAAAIPPQTIRFADGSSAAPLSAESVVRAAEDGPRAVVVSVERGGAHFEVVHRPDRTFVVNAGGAA